MYYIVFIIIIIMEIINHPNCFMEVSFAKVSIIIR